MLPGQNIQIICFLQELKNYKITKVFMKKKYSKLNELILTFFYCGKSKYAPGTVGSIGALFIWIWINNYFSNNSVPTIIQISFWLLIIIGSCAYSIANIQHYHMLKNSRDIDHKSIVIDEAVGIFIALEIFNLMERNLYILNQAKFLIYVAFCTILFRILDITKPSFIGTCDRKIKNPFGVMFDDILCGIISGISTLILYKFTADSSFFKIINCG